MEYVFRAISMPGLSLKKLFLPGIFVLRHLHDHFVPHARNNYHPHIFGHRMTVLFSMALVSLKIFTIALVSFGPIIPAYSSAISVENIIALTNQSRNEFSLSGLSQNPLLAKAAQAKANDMLEKAYFSHNSPDGKTPWTFIQSTGYNYLMAGENLAVNFTESEAVEQAWMNSPGHKANILNKNFEEIGIGISQGEFQGHTAVFVVQMFGTPTEQKVIISEKATPVLMQDVPAPAAASPKPVAQSLPVAAALGAKTEVVADPALSQLAILDAHIDLKGEQILLSAKVSAEAVKVLAILGKQAVMLSPKTGNTWEGYASLENLAQGMVSVQIKAYDMAGRVTSQQLASFSNNAAANYHVLGASSQTQTTWLGKTFDPNSFEKKFYLLFITGMLTSLILAIGIRRHVHHLSLVTNGSFVVILAILLWTMG